MDYAEIVQQMYLFAWNLAMMFVPIIVIIFLVKIIARIIRGPKRKRLRRRA